MKISRLVMLGSASIGVTAGALFLGMSNEAVFNEVKAYSATKTILYVEAFDGYDDSADTEMYMSYKDSSGSNETIIKKTTALGNHKYTFEVPSDIGSFQVFRGRSSSHADYDSTNDGCNWANGWNYTGYITYDANKNYCKITDWSKAYSYYNVFINHMAEGEKIYVTIDNKDYNWFDGNAHFSIYLWDDISGQKKVLDASRLFESTTFVATLDENFDCNGFKAIRVASDANFDGSDWSKSVVWNQGNDVVFTSENADCRAVISRARTGEWNYGDGFEKITPSYFAKAFAYYFLEKTDGYCAASITDETQNALATAFEGFETIQTGTKAAFSSGAMEHTNDGWRSGDARVDATKEARSRYYNMVKETGHFGNVSYGDFLNIEQNLSGVSFSASTIVNSGDLNIVIPLIIAAVSIVSFAGYAIARKVRKDN